MVYYLNNLDSYTSIVSNHSLRPTRQLGFDFEADIELSNRGVSIPEGTLAIVLERFEGD